MLSGGDSPTQKYIANNISPKLFLCQKKSRFVLYDCSQIIIDFNSKVRKHNI